MTEQEMATIYPGRGFNPAYPARPKSRLARILDILRGTSAGRPVVAELERLRAEVERLRAEAGR